MSVQYVIGPNGCPLSVADLPPPGTVRWVVRRKAEVVAAVRGGLLTAADACKRWPGLSAEELHDWAVKLDRFGTAGLRVSRTQQYRVG